MVLGVLGLIVLGALLLRTVDIANNPRGFFTDEAGFGYSAERVLHTGKDEHGETLPLLFKSSGEYKLPAFIYAEIPFIAVLGLTETAVRLTSAVLGTLTVVSIFLLARELFRKETTALLAAGFLAVMPWHIHYSRTGLGDIVILPLVFTLALWLFFRAMRLGGSAMPALVLFALCFYCYRAAWVVLPPACLLLAVMYREELLARWRDTAIGVAVAGLMLLPIALHLLAGGGDRGSQVWIFSLDNGRSLIENFSDFYRSYFSYGFLFSEGDNGPVTRHFLPGHGQLYVFQLPLLLLGVVALVRRLNRRGLFVLALVVLYPLSGALSDLSPISSRAILGSIVMALVSAAGLAFAIEMLGRVEVPNRRYVLGALAVMALMTAGLSVGRYVERYHNEYPKLSADFWGWQEGPEEILRYFVSVQDEYDQMVMDDDFNAPGVFLPFYLDEPCRKCSIGARRNYDPELRQLFALRPQNLPSDGFSIIQHGTISYPNGEVAFVFVELR